MGALLLSLHLLCRLISGVLGIYLHQFFYKDESSGEATAGLLDWQVCARGSVLLDLPWMIQGSANLEFAREHGAEFFDLYFDALQKAMGSVKLDKALWEEQYYLAYVFNIVKALVACGGLDANSPGMVDTINFILGGWFDAIDRLPLVETWEKCKRGELRGQNGIGL